MTNETKAPERIWLELDGEDFIFHCNPDPQMIYALKSTDSAFAYVPENLSDPKEARIAELEVENRELAMQCIASDGQAQMAYEEQVRLEAKLAKAVDALEHEVKRSRRHLAGSTLDTLAELKGGE